MLDPVVVYTAGVYDMFHVGHLNLLKMAKGLGDKLIVAVSTDDLVERHKPGQLVIPYEQRAEIVSAIKYVDVCVPQKDRDKFEAWKRLKYNVLAVGDDWFGREDFEVYEKKLTAVGVKVVYLPYTEHISSSILRRRFREAT